MKIVQGALLVFVGALAAVVYMEVKEAPAHIQRTAIQQPSPPPAPEPPPPATPAPAPIRAPEPAPAVKKRHKWSKPAPVSAPVLAALQPAELQPAAPVPVSAPTPVVTTPPPPQVIETVPAEIAPPAPEAPPPPRQATLTAGMLVPVRLQETISSDHYLPGDTFTAVLDQPLVVDGLVIAEKGARVEGKIVESQQAGRVKGVASVALELTRLALSDGQHIEISTDSFTKMGPGSHGADAAKIGGGAALGAIIGAIAGGGKGAAIGAGVGGAAGTGAVVGTRGKPAVLPGETKISFRLNNTVTVTERRRGS